MKFTCQASSEHLTCGSLGMNTRFESWKENDRVRAVNLGQWLVGQTGTRLPGFNPSPITF